MPKPVCRVGDANEVGGIILNGEATVLVEGRPVAVLGAAVTPHPCCGLPNCPPLHCAANAISTLTTVLAGGLPVVALGDTDTCGHTRVAGSTTVFVG